MKKIQFSISIVFVYTQLNVKTVLFQKFQFSVSIVLMSKTVLFQTTQFRIKKFPFQAIQFSISIQFKCQNFYFNQFSLAYVHSLYVKNSSISSNSV